MIVCHTDTEFERALKARADKIILEGPKASEIVKGIEAAQRKKRNTRNTALGIGLLCVLAAPFTGGGSLLGLGATAGAVALSEPVILGIISAVVAISKTTINAIKDYKIRKLDVNRIEFTRKN